MLLLGESKPVLTEGLFCLVVTAVFLVMIPVTAVFERRRLRRAKARFLGRQALPDAAFLSQAGVSADEGAFFLAARRAMAELSAVPPEMIYPEDTWRSLMDLQWDNGFLEDIVIGLERELDTRLPMMYPADDRLPFTVYVKQLAMCLKGTNEGQA
jgi:hypothetical protein